MHIDLTDDERRYVDAYTAAINATRIVPWEKGIDDLLTDWDRFVDDVESGQSEYMVEDYLNEVTGRRNLDDLATDAPRSLQRKIADAVAGVDARYLAATDPEDPPHWSTPDRFTWYREPRWPFL